MQVLKVLRFLALFLASLCLSLNLPCTFKKELFTTGQYISSESDLKDHKEVSQPQLDLLISVAAAAVVEQHVTKFLLDSCPALSGNVDRSCSYHLLDIPPPHALV